MRQRHSLTINNRRVLAGQAALEYALFIAVVAAAVVGMAVYVQRAVQANLRGVEQRLNAEAAAP